jgi:hypothetical protein
VASARYIPVGDSRNWRTGAGADPMIGDAARIAAEDAVGHRRKRESPPPPGINRDVGVKKGLARAFGSSAAAGEGTPSLPPGKYAREGGRNVPSGSC